MPVYEYICQKCDAHFDLLRSIAQADSETCCPECQTAGARRALSRFASFTKSSDGSTSSVGGGCASCGGGSCGTCQHH